MLGRGGKGGTTRLKRKQKKLIDFLPTKNFLRERGGGCLLVCFKFFFFLVYYPPLLLLYLRFQISPCINPIFGLKGSLEFVERRVFSGGQYSSLVTPSGAQEKK